MLFNGIHRTRSPGCAFFILDAINSLLGYDVLQASRSSAIQHDTVRCGFLSQRSYVAPSRQRRSSSKRPRKELTYCPIYGFKSFLICAKELTPALFCCLDISAAFLQQAPCSAIVDGAIHHLPQPRGALWDALHRCGQRVPSMRCSAAPGRRSLSLSPYPSTLECHHAARPHRCSQR